MRLYLDQMFQPDMAEALRAEGHEVVRAAEIGQDRADDAKVISRAILDGRVLVTLDEHFGDWTVLPLATHPGVIRLKIHPTTTDNAMALLSPFLTSKSQSDLADCLVILSSKKVRWIRTG